MISRLTAATVALVLMVAAVTGCSAPPSPPEPSPAFTSEDEAFAAAEATYRAYVDALNNVDLSDPSTFEDVYAWTTGDFNAGERKTLSKMHADGWTVSGITHTTQFRGDEFEPGSEVVISATVCSDVSDVRVADSTGKSMVSPNRADVYALEVQFVEESSTETGLAISSSNAVTDDLCT